MPLAPRAVRPLVGAGFCCLISLISRSRPQMAGCRVVIVSRQHHRQCVGHRLPEAEYLSSYLLLHAPPTLCRRDRPCAGGVQPRWLACHRFHRPTDDLNHPDDRIQTVPGVGRLRRGPNVPLLQDRQPIHPGHSLQNHSLDSRVNEIHARQGVSRPERGKSPGLDRYPQRGRSRWTHQLLQQKSKKAKYPVRLP